MDYLVDSGAQVSIFTHATMEHAGIISCADGPWASLLHLVKKPNGHLNNTTIPDCYPLPNVRDFIVNLHDWKFFFEDLGCLSGW